MVTWLKKNTNLLFFILIIAFTIPAVWSLLKSGYFQSDDGEWMVIRFSAFYQALRDGEFPVRFLSRLNFGYGYPVANFLYPGFMYIAVPIHILGFGFVSTVKILFGLSLMSSAAFCFLWLSKLFNKFSAFIGSLFFLYTPYHLYDVYRRGSLGEVLALSLVPFIFWQIERKSLIWISFGTAFLILAHNTLALLFLPIIFIYAFVRNRKSINYHLLTIILGFGLSSFFWIPAVFELGYTQFGNTQISNPLEYFADITLVGFSSIILLLAAAYYIFKHKIKEKNLPFLAVLFFALSILTLFLSTGLSSFIWRFIPASFVQFPFRLLSYLLLSNAFLASFIVSHTSEKRRIAITTAGIIILAYSALFYIAPQVTFDKKDSFYSTNEATTTVKDEYMPKWVKVKPFQHFKEKVEVIDGKGQISNVITNSKLLMFNYNSDMDSVLKINTIYYPGWNARVNGKEVKIQFENPEGVIQIAVPTGESFIELKFSETFLRLFADGISILSFILLILIQRPFRFGIIRP